MAESGRKSYTYKLPPTPEQERALERVWWRWRTLETTALEQRIRGWERAQVCVSRHQQAAAGKAIRAEMPAVAARHRHVLQDVRGRLDKAYPAVFRRLKAGAAPGLPRFPGAPPLAFLHLQAVWPRRARCYRLCGAGQDWPHGPALEAPYASKAPQARHDLPRGGWLVGEVLLCRGAHAARAANWT